MFLRLEPNSGIPLGVQITRGLRLAIAQGRLEPGQQLPSARDLAGQLQVNFHTVRKAFGDLEAAGLLEVRRGRGTFVADVAQQLVGADLEGLVRSHVERLVEDLAGTDLDAEAIQELVVRELARALRNKNEGLI